MLGQKKDISGGDTHQPNSPGTQPWLSKLGSLLIATRENTLHGATGGVSGRGG